MVARVRAVVFHGIEVRPVDVQVQMASGLPANVDADGTLLEQVAAPDAAGRALLTEAAGRLKLTARGYHRVSRVARTLADLEGGAGVRRRHIVEALSYRRLSLGRAVGQAV